MGLRGFIHPQVVEESVYLGTIGVFYILGMVIAFVLQQMNCWWNNLVYS